MRRPGTCLREKLFVLLQSFRSQFCCAKRVHEWNGPGASARCSTARLDEEALLLCDSQDEQSWPDFTFAS